MDFHGLSGGIKYVETSQKWSNVREKFQKELGKTLSYIFKIKEDRGRFYVFHIITHTKTKKKKNSLN